MLIDLILLGPGKEPKWDLGKSSTCDFTVTAINEIIEKKVFHSDAEACLFWNAAEPLPAPELLKQLLEQRAVQVWHAGLKRGLSGLPGIIDFVSPCWTLNCDAPSVLESNSWRLSLDACLIRTEVLKKMGGIYTAFSSVEAAGLEMGLRFMTRGIFMRYVPGLSCEKKAKPALVFEDELRFIYCGYGSFWMKWAIFRAAWSGYASLGNIIKAWNRVRKEKRPAVPQPFPHEIKKNKTENFPKVSVLIPTLCRYGYLRQLLPQLAGQSVPPFEIIIVDQTPEAKRDVKLLEDFSHLPIRLIYQNEPGQCASRNEGLCSAKGDYILFLDDDDEIFQDLIEKHLENMNGFQTRVSSGVAYERGSGNLPENFSYVRMSDVFPTNNSLIEKKILEKSGLFDLAYNRKQRADGDLGMRIYLSGENMVLAPSAAVIHHHSSSGGLRTHKARTRTYAASRTSIWTRRILSDSEIYFGMRYFSQRQVREMMWIAALGTFSSHKSAAQKFFKCIAAIIFMPDTLIKLVRNFKSAKKMMKIYPKIDRPVKK